MTDERTPIERFEDLAKRLFSVVKKDVDGVEETVEEFADEIVKPEEPTPDE
jgi:hypothetical protein